MKTSRLTGVAGFLRCSTVVLVLGAVAVVWGQALTASSSNGSIALKPRTTETSVVILPVKLGERPAPRVAEAIGLLLEKNGLKNIDVGTAPFKPPVGMEIGMWGSALQAFLQQHPVTADYVLYAEFTGDHGAGLNELRAVLADALGSVVWTDCKTSADPAFQEFDAREPMNMAVLLAVDLGPQFGLNIETAKAAKPGKFAQLMDQRSGLPPSEERAALVGRQREFSLARATAKILVYPVRIGGTVDSEGAGEIARKLCQAGIGKACAVAPPLTFAAARPDPNEMKALWDLARQFKEYLKNHPSEADYALYADYGFTVGQWEQGFVHFILCDACGEWVIVDLQNSHQRDYQGIKPVSRPECSELVVRRLQDYITKAMQASSGNRQNGGLPASATVATQTTPP